MLRNSIRGQCIKCKIKHLVLYINILALNFLFLNKSCKYTSLSLCHSLLFVYGSGSLRVQSSTVTVFE